MGWEGGGSGGDVFADGLDGDGNGAGERVRGLQLV